MNTRSEIFSRLCSLGILIMICLSLAACGRPKTALHSTSAAAAALNPCKVPGVAQEVLCGQLKVFENRETRAGRTIELNVVVLPALDPNSKEAPLFHLEGGPGVAATGVADFYANDGKEYRRRRDVVLVDQRGTGKSNPLSAPARMRSPQEFLTEMYPVEYVKKLRATLEAHADLTQYTTSIAMDDLDDVRAWLGYERINLFGLSYGTRAALVYMRQHADRVRSAILMSTAPTDLKMPSWHARAAQRGMDLLLNECSSDAACREAFPQLRSEWEELLARLEHEPARVEYAPPDKSPPVTVQIERVVFAEKLRNAMYSPAGARRIPFIIHRAAGGDFGPFLELAIPADRGRPEFIADGMYLSVTCSEDTPFIDQEVTARANAGNWFANYRVEQQSRACSMWPQGKIPEGYHEPVRSDAPTLIVSGERDPVTPPELGETVARSLPNSRQIVVRHMAHMPDGLTNVECLDRIMLDFLEKADAKELDVTCPDKMLPPAFATTSAR